MACFARMYYHLIIFKIIFNSNLGWVLVCMKLLEQFDHAALPPEQVPISSQHQHPNFDIFVVFQAPLCDQPPCKIPAWRLEGKSISHFVSSPTSHT